MAGTTFKILKDTTGRIAQLRKQAQSKKSVLKVGVFGPKAGVPKKIGKNDLAVLRALGSSDQVKRVQAEQPTLVEVATKHEFGLGVPQRSFLRATIEMKRAEIRRDLERITLKMIRDLSFDFTDGLKILGVKLQGAVQRRISDGIDPPNSPETIERKGSATPLIDTGQLRSSITHAVEEQRR